MPVETGDKISDLNPLWPERTDPKSEGPDHFWLLKNVVQNDALPLSQGGTVTGDVTVSTSSPRLTVETGPENGADFTEISENGMQIFALNWFVMTLAYSADDERLLVSVDSAASPGNRSYYSFPPENSGTGNQYYQQDVMRRQDLAPLQSQIAALQSQIDTMQAQIDAL